MRTRPCRYCVSLQGNAVFADFDVDAAGRVVLRRISFDSYGCCNAAASTPMSRTDSDEFLSALERDTLTAPAIERLLRAFFRAQADALWPDALQHHELI